MRSLQSFALTKVSHGIDYGRVTLIPDIKNMESLTDTEIVLSLWSNYHSMMKRTSVTASETISMCMAPNRS